MSRTSMVGELHNASPNDAATHLGCLLMNYLLKVNVTHVPYRSTGAGLHLRQR